MIMEDDEINSLNDAFEYHDSLLFLRSQIREVQNEIYELIEKDCNEGKRVRRCERDKEEKLEIAEVRLTGLLSVENKLLKLYEEAHDHDILVDYWGKEYECQKLLEKETDKDKLHQLKKNKRIFNCRAKHQIRWWQDLPLPSEEFDQDKYENKYDSIKLIIQYYDEENLDRRAELIEAIQKNIDNESIDKIYCYLEKSNNRTSDEMKSDFVIPTENKIEFIETSDRLTYEMTINLSKKDNDSKSVYLVANNDCYFDETVNLLKKVNYQNGELMVCITRKDQLENGEITYSVEPGVGRGDYEFETVQTLDRAYCNRLGLASQDAWAFTSDFKSNFDSKIKLGTFNCEYFFTVSAYKSEIKLRNVIEYVNCIHIHNTQFRREYAIVNKITSNNLNLMFPSEKNPRTSQNYINGTWRIRTPENYIDQDEPIQKYTEYFVENFGDICR